MTDAERLLAALADLPGSHTLYAGACREDVFSDGTAVVPVAELRALLAGLRVTRDRLREALTWTVGFIRCNFPATVAPYPDYRNACDLLAEAGGIVTGEFTLTRHRAELAEAEVCSLRAERDRLRAFCEHLEVRLLAHGDPFSGDDMQLMQDVRAALGKKGGG